MTEPQPNEVSRLAALEELDVLDTPPEDEFDGLVKVAASACNCPISLITMVDLHRQWFKANVGLDGILETSRDVAFCAHTIQDDGIFEVRDAASDSRFIDNPLVAGERNVRFYAGATLRLSNGAHVGTLCVIDRQPRQLTSQQRDILHHLSVTVVRALESRRVRQKLANSEARFRALSAAAPLGIFSTDSEGACTYTNERWQTIFNLSQAEALGFGWSATIHADDKNAIFTQWRRAAKAHQEFDMEFRIQHPGKKTISVRAISRPIIAQDGQVSGQVGSVEDVTEQRKHINELNYRATHDALTGLVNRSEFEARLQDQLNQALVQGSEQALMYIDLDQFKLINDACGHSKGDLLLVQVARILQQVVRSGDTLARLGGDEFGVILNNCTSREAQRVAQSICDSLDAHRYESEERRFRIGASIGLVPLDRRWSDIESAMQAADSSCYAAKEAGRNRVHAWCETDRAIHTRRRDMQWATRLEHALDEGKFVLYAQRIKCMKDKNTGIHAEVLVRMHDTDGSLILPNTFLPAAERFNLATRLDYWILESSLQALTQLPSIADIKRLYINLSGQSVSDRAFHKDAIHLLKEVGSDVCQRICFEITETAAVTNMTDANCFIDQIRALGVSVALDDFGSGASSFGYLKSLPVDVLKINGEFITGVIDDPLDGVAVRCFVDIARVMNLKIVAECVETQSVHDYLKEIGIDYVQGNFLHQPEPIDRVLNLPGCAPVAQIRLRQQTTNRTKRLRETHLS